MKSTFFYFLPFHSIKQVESVAPLTPCGRGGETTRTLIDLDDPLLDNDGLMKLAPSLASIARSLLSPQPRFHQGRGAIVLNRELIR
ncbi:MAG: hypothetical protein B6D76_02470 [gamma proteobacterium symbiont of Stewartia floridana]|nr:MAG: hypothetical protein B6D76_02470 [gamma proteobacterium symbiont of Stewartia floridana]RLW65244.1 MAG: hypothetical protein B6D73_07975 [gamma proteobacterium symbiont of Stewartia floridana]